MLWHILSDTIARTHCDRFIFFFLFLFLSCFLFSFFLSFFFWFVCLFLCRFLFCLFVCNMISIKNHPNLIDVSILFLLLCSFVSFQNVVLPNLMS